METDNNVQNSWGLSAMINLRGCNSQLITSAEPLEKYIIELCKLINMKRRGPAMIEEFGKDRLKGFSAMQFIETSSIVVHCDDKQGRVFIDIFSCRDFDAEKTAEFSRKFFKADNYTLQVMDRS